MNENIMVLSDGRQLGYSLYGDLKGIPLFLFHGTPGSRVWFTEDDSIAKELGIYLIATDRPGYGLSDKKHHFKLLDYAQDMEELAKHLELENFSVLGVSGGGAFAAAVTYALPNQVEVCMLVGTATPFENGKPPTTMSKENRIGFYMTKYCPWLLKQLEKSKKKLIDQKPELYIENLKKGGSYLSDWDNNMLQRDEVLENGVLHSKEAYRQGVDGVIDESKLLTKDWGFKVEKLTTPVIVWHGEKDTFSSYIEVRNLANKIPQVETHYLEEAGHFLTESDEVWRSILTSFKESVLSPNRIQR
ncbi:alpha/beta fold hydrolase [Fictibacillus phosphorivorans]|uniref:alpha/beta fold hydrolase n=1 Tax=Fictibacillus phosphorivorans TaxID=1221500 RepID=UPI001293CEF5|nr:alpha/beta hydrolase [Fictibacillus phosphorivorans]MQR94350.1 alpha/beta hydrolase [Fictibacillus phosphorivorans]